MFNLWHAIALKIPLLLLVVVVWWFIREEPEDTSASDEDGGTHVHPAHDRPPHRPGPGGRRPSSPRRGPHGDPTPSAPQRVRTVKARSQVRERG